MVNEVRSVVQQSFFEQSDLDRGSDHYTVVHGEQDEATHQGVAADVAHEDSEAEQAEADYEEEEYEEEEYEDEEYEDEEYEDEEYEDDSVELAAESERDNDSDDPLMVTIKKLPRRIS